MMRGVLALSLVLAAFLAIAAASTESPLVSVIIPTHGRNEFLKKAIELIQRQDYPNLEVIIVDDSEQPSQDLPVDDRIKYFHLGSRVSIGEKRNIAVHHSQGVVIVHWDDDDFFRPHRISSQVAPILSGETDMTVLEHHYYFHLPSQTFYTVKRASSWGPHFATFVYRRSIFESGVRYPDNSMAEDYAFAEFALEKGYKILVQNNEDGKNVYLRHHNTWEFEFSDYDAQVRAVPRPSFFSEEDYAFYLNVKTSVASKPPKHYASDKVKWNRRELHPTVPSDGIPAYYPPYYPKYNNDDDGGLSDAAKIGIGIGVAGGVVLIVGVGIAAYFFFQWRKNNDGYVRINDSHV